MINSKLLLVGCLGMSFVLTAISHAQASAEDKRIRAWVSVERGENGMVVLQPKCNSQQAMAVSYYLIVEKMSQGGTSISKQAGAADLQPDVEHDLGVVSINLNPADRCRVQLQVIAQGRVVAQDDFWLGPYGQ